MYSRPSTIRLGKLGNKADYFSGGRQAAMFTLGLSVAAAGLGIWLRRGTGDMDAHAAAMSLVFVAAVTLGPLVVLERLRMNDAVAALFYGPLVVAFVLLIALMHSWGGIGQAIAGAAALLSVGDLLARERWKNLPKLAVLFVIGLSFGLVVAVQINGGRYLTAFTQDFFPLGADGVNTDTYMHLAFAQMIRHQHVVSTGVDGVTPITMYALAHALIAWLSELLMEDTVQAASEIYSIIMLPLMLGSALSGAIALTLGKGRLAAAAVVVGVSVLLYPLQTFFFSETYVAALFLFMSMLVPSVAGLALRMAHERWSRTAIAVVGLAGISLSTFGKPGVGILGAGLYGLAAWIDAWRRPALAQRILWAALSALAVAIVFIPSFLAVSSDIFSSVVSVESERPYYYALTWIPIRRFLISNSVILLAILGVLLLRNLFGNREQGNVLLLVLTVFMVAANIPGFFPIGVQWQYYIINVQMWLGLPVLAALASALASNDDIPGTSLVKELVIVAASVAVSIALFDADSFKARYVDNINVSREKMLQARADGTVRARAKVLAEIINYREHFGTRLRVYAPPNHVAFWTSVPHCEARSMTIPAATAVPMIQGYPPLWTQCASEIKYRGWQVIKPRVSDDRLDDEALCRSNETASGEALAIYVLESLADPDLNHVVDCAIRTD